MPHSLREIAFLLILALLMLAGCDPVTPQVERAIERELPQMIGPAESYAVSIDGIRARVGEARRVSVRGEGVRPADAPALTELHLELHGVRYDRRAERLEHVERAEASARLLASDLASFLETHHNVRGAVVVLLEPGHAVIRLRPAVAGLALPPGITADLRGSLGVRDGRLYFEVSDLRAAGANLGTGAAMRLSESINPLLDLTGSPARLHLTAVSVRDGALVLEATADPMELAFR